MPPQELRPLPFPDVEREQAHRTVGVVQHWWSELQLAVAVWSQTCLWKKLVLKKYGRDVLYLLLCLSGSVCMCETDMNLKEMRHFELPHLGCSPLRGRICPAGWQPTIWCMKTATW